MRKVGKNNIEKLKVYLRVHTKSNEGQAGNVRVKPPSNKRN